MAPGSRRAAIDVGTNSVRLLVADVVEGPGPSSGSAPLGRPPEATGARASDAGAASPLRPVLRRLAITRLGAGLEEGGSLDPAAVERTAAAVQAFAGDAAGAGAPDPEVVGTYALRAARNPELFLGRLARPVRVLSGAEEARLGFLGAAAGLGRDGAGEEIVVLDIGGGSVELTRGDAFGVAASRSVPLGCVVLTRRFLFHDPPDPREVARLRAHAGAVLDAQLGALRRRGAALVGVGGTITTLAALAQRLSPYDPDRVHGFQLTAAQVAETLADLLARPLAQRPLLPGLQAKRADVIIAGALVLEHVLRGLGARTIRVSEADLLWAVVLGL